MIHVRRCVVRSEQTLNIIVMWSKGTVQMSCPIPLCATVDTMLAGPMIGGHPLGNELI
jgi:hypothetical protein